MTDQYERFASSFVRSLRRTSRHIGEDAEVTARRMSDSTIRIEWDSTIAMNQRGELIIDDDTDELVPAPGGFVDLCVVRGDAPTIVWDAR